MVTERKIITDVVNRLLLKEYVKKFTERSGFGGIDIQRTPMGTLVTLIAERPGMVIGHRGRSIKELTAIMENKFNFDNPQIEVEEVKNPNLNAGIMAYKLAVALERGWHFRRAGHSTVRKIMGAGARGCQVVIAGKLTGQRHRTEKFKKGHIKYCGESALETMNIGYAVAKKKLGTIGIKVMIMKPDAVLPDEIDILSQEEAKGIVPEKEVEELKIDTSIHEEEEKEIIESLIKEGGPVAVGIPEPEVPIVEEKPPELPEAEEKTVEEPKVEMPAEEKKVIKKKK
ncbi:MAG: 30S ribosomal protein S3, partial [Thermoplasmata archaeon]|nr:30S ribosomal protein S3 [Thermoplasmata archaeon]